VSSCCPVSFSSTLDTVDSAAKGTNWHLSSPQGVSRKFI